MIQTQEDGKMFQKLLVINDVHNWLCGLHITLKVCLMFHQWEFNLQFPTNFYKSVVQNHTLNIDKVFFKRTTRLNKVSRI